MSKRVVASLVIVWAVIILVVIGLIVQPRIAQGTGQPFSVSFGRRGDGILLKEETSPSFGVREFLVSVPFQDIELIFAEDENFSVAQYGASDTPENLIFTMSFENGKLAVRIESRQGISIGIHISAEEKLIVRVPRDWSGDVSVATASGEIRAQEGFSWGSVTLGTASGDVWSREPLICENLRIDTASGGIRCEGALSVRGSLFLDSASGDIRTAGMSAQSIDVNTISGSVRMEGETVAADAFGVDSASGDIRSAGSAYAGSARISSVSGEIEFVELNVENYKISSASGSVRVGGAMGSGSIETVSGNIRAALGSPVGSSSFSSASGDVRLTVPDGLSFTFEGNTASGDIESDFPMTYLNKFGSHAEIREGADSAASLSVETISGNIEVRR